jgi:hypothetical protein
MENDALGSNPLEQLTSLLGKRLNAKTDPLLMSTESEGLNRGLLSESSTETMRPAAGEEFRDLLTLVRQSGLFAKQPAD